jgi:hypothetical protein
MQLEQLDATYNFQREATQCLQQADRCCVQEIITLTHKALVRFLAYQYHDIGCTQNIFTLAIID